MLVVMKRAFRGLMVAVSLTMAVSAHAAEGPWNVEAISGGSALEKPLAADANPATEWTLHGWVKPSAVPAGQSLIVGQGDPAGPGRFLYSNGGAVGAWLAPGRTVDSGARLKAGRWQALALVARAGKVAVFVDGRQVAEGALPAGQVAPRLVFAPRTKGRDAAVPFAGQIAGLTLESRALDAQALARIAGARPDEALTRYEQASPNWPMQLRQQTGYTATQAPATLPRGRAPFDAPKAVAPGERKGLHDAGEGSWILQDWYLASARDVAAADGPGLSRPAAAQGKGWYAATVPGTVLGTLVDRGIYPDPDHGLNNMAIPESLNRQDWWYRTEFDVPADLAGKQLRLDFNGINYAAEIWLNGKHLGSTRGAFVRGMFDVTSQLQAGRRNALAVKVSPPPHPGIPHEQSIAGGVGENGGMLVIDGPTFVASEGWDWIPAVRDRNTGLWQDVRLHATGPVAIGDAWVVSRLQQDHAAADLSIEVPLKNDTGAAVSGEVSIEIEGIRASRQVSVAQGQSSVRFEQSEFPQLRLRNPRLWWPNGYGEPALYTMGVAFTANGAESDRKDVRFGVREISYELSLFDAAGQLERVEFTPADDRGERVVDVRHEAIRKTPNGWAQSFLPGSERSPAIRRLQDTRLHPFLTLRVNGVRIAVKGGNWGTDDWRKRASRERLEPYFRLQRDANMNVIRNWVGQSTQDSLYELADEYGMLLMNDFWASTQNYNQQIEDEALFLRNAADVISRYRHHPSVVLWFGRNEGVPHPLLNEGLDELVARMDGTRLYMGSSNDVNLQISGPYNYREPTEYFTSLAKGFSVEVGTPSFATLEAFKAMVPEPDRWPISDAWAYHDWHRDGNGATTTFMASLARKFGEATSLEDFERKAQLMNYETHRAMFEGFNAGLWSENSGRLLWMSHPAWPSLMWQIYSHDYDTHGAYYGAKKAAEPLHVQMNLPGHELVLVNNTAAARKGLQVKVTVVGVDGGELGKDTVRVDAGAVAVTPVAGKLDIDALVRREGVAFVALQLLDAEGKALGDNFYWASRTPDELRRLGTLPKVELQVQAVARDAQTLRVRVRNPASTVVLSAKLTLVDDKGERILPAYYSDNYINLLPGEERELDIEVPAGTSLDKASIGLRGWNVADASVTPGNNGTAGSGDDARPAAALAIEE